MKCLYSSNSFTPRRLMMMDWSICLSPMTAPIPLMPCPYRQRNSLSTPLLIQKSRNVARERWNMPTQRRQHPTDNLCTGTTWLRRETKSRPENRRPYRRTMYPTARKEWKVPWDLLHQMDRPCTETTWSRCEMTKKGLNRWQVHVRMMRLRCMVFRHYPSC